VADELRGAALRPDAALRERVLVDTGDVPRTGDLAIRRPVDLAPDESDDEPPEPSDGSDFDDAVLPAGTVEDEPARESVR
jgi:hypothetical protein